MRNWQDYATDSNTNSSHKPIPAKLATQKSTPSAPRPPKAWLYFNIFLTLLCVIALVVGFIDGLSAYQRVVSNPEDSLFSLTIQHTAILFTLPGTWLFYLYLLLTGQATTNGSGIAIMGTFVSGFLGFMLIVNTFIALRSYLQHRRTNLSRRFQKNLIFATIPPIFIIVILIILFFLPFIMLPHHLA